MVSIGILGAYISKRNCGTPKEISSRVVFIGLCIARGEEVWLPLFSSCVAVVDAADEGVATY